tara:strand:+ start:669 stop:944 length:276 start_codon:yes stop_codon:yes gene_type:complete
MKLKDKIDRRKEEQRIIAKWTGEARNHLMGRTITNVRYMTDEEQEDFGWYSKSVIIELDNGTGFFPMADDEGNDAGALGTNFKNLDTIPVI